MIYTIDVTQQDIDTGKKANCSECPVAQAFQRTTGKAQASFIGSKILDLPWLCRDWIEGFDNGVLCPPFSFYVEVPDNRL